MMIDGVAHRSLSEVKSASFDLFVAASGYESRARWLAEQVQEVSGRQWAFGFVENRDAGARAANDAYYAGSKFVCHLLESGAGGPGLMVDEFIGGLPTDQPVRILVDFSSMTRSWYGSIVSALANCRRTGRISCVFWYSTAAFHPPPSTYPPNEIVGPVTGFSGLGLPARPTALVLGLGHDPERALGVKEFLDAPLTIVFKASPPVDPLFQQTVEAANHDLLACVPRELVLDYPVLEPVATISLLDSVCAGLVRDSSVVLVSLGPKLFGLCCFLVAAHRPEVSVWRIGAGAKEEPVDRRPGGAGAGLEVTWR
jgi:hypothetical protein